jgi:hypothetical protein
LIENGNTKSITTTNFDEDLDIIYFNDSKAIATLRML